MRLCLILVPFFLSLGLLQLGTYLGLSPSSEVQTQIGGESSSYSWWRAGPQDLVGKFAFELWPTYIVPSNTTMNISTTPPPTLYIHNQSPETHTLQWFLLPAGASSPCAASVYCTLKPLQLLQMSPITVNGTYQFVDETSGLYATLIVIK